MADSRSRLRPGDRVGPYELVEEIGSGGQGTVFEAVHWARDGLDGQSEESRPLRVALKVLHSDSSGGQSCELLEDEARIGSSLGRDSGCKNIVATLGCGHGDGYSFLAMELIKPCINLYEAWELYRTRGVQIEPYYALQAAIGILNALDYAHLKIGLIHRDVKPSNILLGAGTVKLTDFGVSRSRVNLLESIPGLYFKGTLSYAAPEQLQPGTILDARADLYPVAVILFELLTMTPFQVFPGDAPALAARIELLRSQYSACPYMPALLRGLSSEPGTRFSSAAAFRSALLECINPLPGHDDFSSWIHAVCRGETPGIKMNGSRISPHVKAGPEAVPPRRQVPTTKVECINDGEAGSAMAPQRTRVQRAGSQSSRAGIRRSDSQLRELGRTRSSRGRSPEPSLSREERIRLRSILGKLFKKPEEIALVVHDSGIDCRRINMSGAPDIVWQAILEEAGAQGADVMRELLVQAQRRAKNPKLSIIIEQIEGMRPASIRERMDEVSPPTLKSSGALRRVLVLIGAVMLLPFPLAVASHLLSSLPEFLRLWWDPRTDTSDKRELGQVEPPYGDPTPAGASPGASTPVSEDPAHSSQEGTRGIDTHRIPPTRKRRQSGPPLLDVDELAKQLQGGKIIVNGKVNIVILGTDTHSNALNDLADLLARLDRDGRPASQMPASKIEFLHELAPYLNEAARRVWEDDPEICLSNNDDFTSLVEMARAATDAQVPGKKIDDLLAQALRAFSCGPERVRSHELIEYTRISALRRIQRDHNDDGGFKRLLTLEPDFELKGSFETFIRNTFASQKLAVASRPWVRVGLAKLPEGYGIRVDGIPMNSDSRLIEGEHFVQLESRRLSRAYGGTVVNIRRTDKLLQLPTPEIAPPTEGSVIEYMLRATRRTGTDSQLPVALQERFKQHMVAGDFMLEVLAAPREDGCSFDLLAIHLEPGLTVAATPYSYTSSTCQSPE